MMLRDGSLVNTSTKLHEVLGLLTVRGSAQIITREATAQFLRMARLLSATQTQNGGTLATYLQNWYDYQPVTGVFPNRGGGSAFVFTESEVHSIAFWGVGRVEIPHETFVRLYRRAYEWYSIFLQTLASDKQILKTISDDINV